MLNERALCAQCGERPRTGAYRVCSPCRKARAKGRATSPISPERNAETVTALRERVTELEGEVARLKRDLAAANARAWPVRGMGRPIPARAEGEPVGAPKHGPGCQCNPCWLERKAGRAMHA